MPAIRAGSSRGSTEGNRDIDRSTEDQEEGGAANAIDDEDIRLYRKQVVYRG